MLQFIQALPEIEGNNISMRIGVHSGACVAGVIGKKKFVYDLWGDAVNTAGRMESHGIPNAIHVSEETARLLEHVFDLKERGITNIKGIGDLKTYFVTGEFDK
jgi:class 3 adenylate cyclase